MKEKCGWNESMSQTTYSPRRNKNGAKKFTIIRLHLKQLRRKDVYAINRVNLSCSQNHFPAACPPAAKPNCHRDRQMQQQLLLLLLLFLASPLPLPSKRRYPFLPFCSGPADGDGRGKTRSNCAHILHTLHTVQASALSLPSFLLSPTQDTGEALRCWRHFYSDKQSENNMEEDAEDKSEESENYYLGDIVNQTASCQHYRAMNKVGKLFYRYLRVETLFSLFKSLPFRLQLLVSTL